MLDTETEIKSLWRALDGNIEELMKRIEAQRIEAQRKEDLAHDIRCRLDALERHPARLGSSEKHIDRRVEDLERETELQWRCLRAEFPSELRNRITSLEGDVKHAVEEEGLLHRIDVLEQKASMCEKHGAALSDVRNLRAELAPTVLEHDRRIDALEQRLRPEIPVVTPLARNGRSGWRDLGNLAVEPTRATRLRCDDCRVTWTGCAAASDCPECGASVDWVAPDYSEAPDGEERAPAIPDYVLAPAPDYSSERPEEVEKCGCEQTEYLLSQLDNERRRANHHQGAAESLRDEVRLLRAELGSASLELRQMAGRAEEAVRERDEARAYAVSCSTQAQTLSAERDAANAQLKQIRAVVAEAYTAPSRAKLREHAWRYLDAARDILAEQPAAPATPDSGALYARSEEPAQCKCPGCRNGFAYCFTLDGGETSHA